MSTRERRAYLRERGWTSYAGGDWRSPDDPDRTFYSLAAAIRIALANDQEAEQ